MINKQAILDRFDFRAYYQGIVPSLTGDTQASGKCPLHDDKKASLSVNLDNGLFNCHGCGEKGSVFDFYMKLYSVDFKTAKEELAAFARISEDTGEGGKKIKAVYDYQDENGVLLYQAVRYEPKDFRPRRKGLDGRWIYDLQGVRRVPYNLPELVTAGGAVIVEGEKDADNLKALGYTRTTAVTTSQGGAKGWKPEYSDYFLSKQVAIIPDNDRPGFAYAEIVARNLHGKASVIKIVELPGLGERKEKHGLDVSDWVESRRKEGRTDKEIKAELTRLIKEAPAWEPKPESEPEPDTTEKTQRVRAVNIADFLALDFPPRENILAPWLPTQGLTMIHAPRGVGKTFIALNIAVSVSSGDTFLRWTASKARSVLYIDGELPAVTVQERLSRTIASTDKEPCALLKIITPDLQASGMPNLATIEGQEDIEPHLKDVSLVIVDNISTLCRAGRENEGESWLPVQEWALKLRSRGLSIVFIHHAGKDGNQRGTSRREDVLDTVINLKRPGDYRPEDGARFEVHFEKARGIHGDDVKPFEAKLIINSDGKQTWAMKDLEESLTERVANLLNDGVPQGEIAEMLKVSKGTVSKHRKKAQNNGMIKANPA